MASLKVWNGNIVPIAKLEEVWVQISGIPPKWCDWETLRQVTSALGKLVEVDWQSLFGSFFAAVRVKIKCRDPRKIPYQRIMEMNDDIFVINFKPEGITQKEGGNEEDNDDDTQGGDDNDHDLDEDDLLDDVEPSNENDSRKGESSKGPENGNEKQKEASSNSQKNSYTPGRSKTVRNLFSTFNECEDETFSQLAEENHCLSLLKAMELDEAEDNAEDGVEIQKNGEEEMFNLPQEWLYKVNDEEMVADDNIQIQVDKIEGVLAEDRIEIAQSVEIAQVEATQEQEEGVKVQQKPAAKKRGQNGVQSFLKGEAKGTLKMGEP